MFKSCIGTLRSVSNKMIMRYPVSHIRRIHLPKQTIPVDSLQKFYKVDSIYSSTVQQYTKEYLKNLEKINKIQSDSLIDQLYKTSNLNIKQKEGHHEIKGTGEADVWKIANMEIIGNNESVHLRYFILEWQKMINVYICSTIHYDKKMLISYTDICTKMCGNSVKDLHMVHEKYGYDYDIHSEIHQYEDIDELISTEFEPAYILYKLLHGENGVKYENLNASIFHLKPQASVLQLQNNNRYIKQEINESMWEVKLNRMYHLMNLIYELSNIHCPLTYYNSHYNFEGAKIFRAGNGETVFKYTGYTGYSGGSARKKYHEGWYTLTISKYMSQYRFAYKNSDWRAYKSMQEFLRDTEKVIDFNHSLVEHQPAILLFDLLKMNEEAIPESFYDTD